MIENLENFERKKEDFFPHTSEVLAPKDHIMCNLAKEDVVACMFKEVLCEDICFEVVHEKETLHPDDRQKESTSLVYFGEDVEMEDASNVVAVDRSFNYVFAILREEVSKEVIVLFKEELEMEKHATNTLGLFLIEKIVLGFGAKFCFDITSFFIPQVPPLGAHDEVVWLINDIKNVIEPPFPSLMIPYTCDVQSLREKVILIMQL